MKKPDAIPLDGVKTYRLGERKSKVKIADFGSAWNAGGTFNHWLDSLPKILAGHDFREVVERIALAVSDDKLVILAMGAHPIKVGLNPVLVDLLERGIISGLAMNGAGIIHDVELAIAGHTSEDVDSQLAQGKFGMAEETGYFLNEAIKEGAKEGYGLGQAVGKMLVREAFPNNRLSILARSYEMEKPVTVHVAVGTDTIHFHPKADGAAIGKTSHRDFRIFAHLVSNLEEGVFINLGSAVILPEVFLKALTVSRNLYKRPFKIVTANFDMISHYRPTTNVVNRPTGNGGVGYNFVGHHEIMIPLLAWGIRAMMTDAGKNEQKKELK